MPIYEYQCSNCSHHFDELQKISEPPLVKCPACGQDTLKRLIGSGAGLIFKGSGFYLTDYKKKSESTASPAPSKHKKEKSTGVKDTASEHKESSTPTPKSEMKKESKKNKK